MGSQRHDVRGLTPLLLAELNYLASGLKPVHLRHIAVHEDDLVGWFPLLLRQDLLLDALEGQLTGAHRVSLKPKLHLYHSLQS